MLNFDLLTHQPGSGVGVEGLWAIYLLPCCCIMIPLNLICNMTLFWKGWILTFWPLWSVGVWGGEGRGSAGKIFATMLLHLWFPLIWDATWPCCKKLNFDLFNPPPGSGGVCRQNMCYLVAASAIRLSLVYNLTMFWKSWTCTFWPYPQGHGGLQSKYLRSCCCICDFL